MQQIVGNWKDKSAQQVQARPGRGAASDPPENNLCMALAFVLPALWNINATRDTQLTHSHTQPWAKTGAETNCCQQELQAETEVEVEVEVEESRAAIVACILYGKAEIMRLSLRLLSPTAWQVDEKQNKNIFRKNFTIYNCNEKFVMYGMLQFLSCSKICTRTSN